MKEILVADCVSKSFGERRVLSSATLRAVPGEVRVLFGRNGIGKSTLLKIAAGWIAPDSGYVHFDGTAYESVRLNDLAAQGLFYLPDHDLLSSAFTVRQQLEMIRRQYDGRDVEEAAESVGVIDHLDESPVALSGGERRRAELAAVVVRRPRCVLADEPLRGIEPRDVDDVLGVFRELAREGVAVLLTGHEVPELLGAADHISWCTSGTTYELGPPDKAMEQEAFKREYLGAWFRPRSA